MNKNVLGDILLALLMPVVGWVFTAAGIFAFVLSIKYGYTYMAVILALVFFTFLFTFSIILLTGRLEAFRANHPFLKYSLLRGGHSSIDGKFGRYFIGPFMLIVTTLLFIFAIYIFFNAPGKS
jgi:hypothetical protein